ncbi:MAG: hypothetical protein OEZ51_12160 [Nitrospinota bacterium]|nr:hypothetical protein [Nitrospinota bacterium]
MRIFITAFLIFLTGCGATIQYQKNYKNFDLSKVDENQGVVIGRVDVELEAKPYDARLCGFCMGSVCHQLFEDGYVFMPLEQGNVPIVSISCDLPGPRGNREYRFGVDQFQVKPGITYIGNLLFSIKKWSSRAYTTSKSEDYTDYQTRKMSGEVDNHLDALVKDEIDGLLSDMFFVFTDASKKRTYYEYSASVSAEDDMSDVLEVFRQQVKKEAQVEKNIIKIKPD